MKSLRLRLSLFFALVAILVWLVTCAIAYFQARHKLDELFDTQQVLFAKSLAYTNLSALFQSGSFSLPETEYLITEGDTGEEDDEALAFAIFSSDGRMLINDGDKGRFIPFSASIQGFAERYLADEDGDDLWRFFYLTASDGSDRIVVGQELEFRQEMALDIIAGMLLPWLITLPLLLIAIVWLIGRELSSLRTVAHELPDREPGDATPIAADRVPSEVQPLVHALNKLFHHMSDALTHERQFTANASHELRTPLSALRVQAEVAQMADDETTRIHALDQFIISIDRTTRLVEQLLALSRLDSLKDIQEVTPVNWSAIVDAVYAKTRPLADERQITLRFEVVSTPPEMNGNTVLLTLLLRNLIDNAIHYIHNGGEVTVYLLQQEIRVVDNGPGVAPEYINRLQERFFRPPGQRQTGSGLGLSIAKRIAELHGFGFHVANRPEGGFSVAISFPSPFKSA
ncbi:MAG: two-component system sensor histidine kinase QseC [Burkholderiales bacterium]|jgi:two-component system sensor histidine kinase QseC|nr:two-component system sensor histidine kinase QseC [Burkholderiales bacterium]